MQTPARRRQARTYRSLARNHRAAVRATNQTTTAQEGTMSQLSDAENAGFNPYAHAAAKREQAAAALGVTAAAELTIIEEWGARVAGKIAEADVDDYVGVLQVYEHMAMAALSLLAPEIARRDAALDRLRDHLLAEADRLDKRANRTMTAGTVAGTLRKIVEATR